MGWGELDMVRLSARAVSSDAFSAALSSGWFSDAVSAVVSPACRAGALVSRREWRGEFFQRPAG